MFRGSGIVILGNDSTVIGNTITDNDLSGISLSGNYVNVSEKTVNNNGRSFVRNFPDVNQIHSLVPDYYR